MLTFELLQNVYRGFLIHLDLLISFYNVLVILLFANLHLVTVLHELRHLLSFLVQVLTSSRKVMSQLCILTSQRMNIIICLCQESTELVLVMTSRRLRNRPALADFWV